MQRAHDARRRAPALDDPQRRPHRRARGRPHRRGRRARRAAGAEAGATPTCTRRRTARRRPDDRRAPAGIRTAQDAVTDRRAAPASSTATRSTTARPIRRSSATRDGGWWMFYTQRRATHPDPGPGVAVGARQPDRRRAQRRRVRVGVRRHPRARRTRAWPCAPAPPPADVAETHWAPDGAIARRRRRWRMYLTEIDGVPDRWDGHDRRIVEYVSDDLRTGRRRGPLPLGSDRVDRRGGRALSRWQLAAVVQGRGGRVGDARRGLAPTSTRGASRARRSAADRTRARTSSPSAAGGG